MKNMDSYDNDWIFVELDDDLFAVEREDAKCTDNTDTTDTKCH